MVIMIQVTFDDALWWFVTVISVTEMLPGLLTNTWACDGEGLTGVLVFERR
jgi:hypothetical protein